MWMTLYSLECADVSLRIYSLSLSPCPLWESPHISVDWGLVFILCISFFAYIIVCAYVYFVFYSFLLCFFVASPSVLWYCWLRLLTCKNRRPYNPYCVGADNKPCLISGWWDLQKYRLRNDQWCVEWDVKPQSVSECIFGNNKSYVDEVRKS